MRTRPVPSTMRTRSLRPARCPGRPAEQSRKSVTEKSFQRVFNTSELGSYACSIGLLSSMAEIVKCPAAGPPNRSAKIAGESMRGVQNQVTFAFGVTSAIVR